MTAPLPPTATTGLRPPTWASSSTALPAGAGPPGPGVAATAAAAVETGAAPETAAAPRTETIAGTDDAALPTEYEPAAYNRPAYARPPRPLAPPPPTVVSDDGRLTLTADTLTVRGRTYPLLELERVDVQPVKWVLYYLAGGIGLAFSIILYLQNQLRTMPFAGLLLGTSLLLLLGWRGTNRLRLHRLARAPLNVALPGDAAAWQRLAAETNRRIRHAHDAAAAHTAALFAAEAAGAEVVIESPPMAS